MGKVMSTLGTLFGSENRWWEQEKQKEKQKEQERRRYNEAQRMKQIEQQAQQKQRMKQIEQQKQTGPAYGQIHDPNKEYKETQSNVLGAIASVSKQPGQTGVSKVKPPYVVQNRNAVTNASKAEAFIQEARQWVTNNLSVDKQKMFWQLSTADQIRVMESQNPDNELNYLSRGR